jgi:hypothetical protein
MNLQRDSIGGGGNTQHGKGHFGNIRGRGGNCN